MTIENLQQMIDFGQRLGEALRGGECLELVGDVGTGKTTLTKGLAKGLEINDDVQSPSFTISRTYPARDGLELHHYDFYRLSDPGIMRYELAESVDDPNVVTAVEWADSVEDVLPDSRLTIRLYHDQQEGSRRVELQVPDGLKYLQEAIWS